MLPERRGDPELETRFLALARDELRRASRLLDAMVDQRRAGARSAESGDVARAVEAAATLLGPRARSRSVRLEAECAAGLPAAALGHDGLHQVLLNLALNAIDASPAGGSVRIAAHARRSGVALDVSDEGPGIARTGRARSRPGGLGLAITRGILEAAGGSLAFALAPSGGTCARVWLPAA